MERSVVLEGGSPWGFRVDGGIDLGRPVTVGKVIPGGKAYHQSLRPGDIILRINQEDCGNLTNTEARHLVRSAGQTLSLDLHRPSRHLSIPRIQISNTDSNSSHKNTSSISCLLAVNVSSRRAESKRNNNMLTSSSGSPLERNKSTGSLPDGEDAVSNAEKSTTTKPSIWSPSGKSGAGLSKPYKSVTFSPLSSTTPVSSSKSSSGSTPARSSDTRLPLPQAPIPQDTTISEVIAFNGVEMKVLNEDQANEISMETSKKRDDVSKALTSTFPESSVENRPPVPSSAPNLKPVKMPSAAIVWKPPSPGSKPKHPEVSKPDPKLSTSVFEWKPVLRDNPVASSPDFGRDAVTSLSARCSDNATTSSLSVAPIGNTSSTSLVATSGKTKPKPKSNPALSSSRAATLLPAVLDCVNIPVSAAQKRVAPASAKLVSPGCGPVPAEGAPSSASLGNRADSSESQPVDLIDLNSSEDDGKLASGQRRKPVNTTVVHEKEPSEDWWDSVFDNNSQKDEEVLSAAVDAMFAREVASAKSQSAARLSSTAAVLHLSSSLVGAIQNASEADREEAVAKKRNALTAAAAAAAAASSRRGQQNSLSGNIIDEWRSGFSSNAKNSDQAAWIEYDRIKGCAEQQNQQKPLEPRLIPPRNLDRAEEGSGKSTAERAENREMREKSKGMSSTISGPVPVIFEGIGPMDEKTGVPIATRVSIDEKNRKDWYRRMYASLHKPDRRSNPRRLTINGTETRRSPTSPEADLLSYYEPHAKYKSQPYRNQPLSIEDYEPGRHSSIALKDKKSDRNRLFESDAEVDYRNGDFECDGEHGDERTGSRKRGVSSTGTRSKSFDRKQYDEETRLRKQEIEAVVAEERRRRYTEEQKLNDARRHGDSYTLVQKKSVLFDRFNDYEVGGGPSVLRPKQIKAVKLRGKAKALYPFKAQNNTELSFKKGDIIYLLRKIDRNWYRGEHNGIVGLLPVTYVEVITSLEEAELMAVQREGKAVAKFDFKPKTSAELALHKGDAVMLIRKIDQNWYEGRIGSRKGIFPVSFVDTIQEPDTPAVTPSPSIAPTPVPDVPPSPTSSLHSGGPDVPSAPASPWNSDFYESEFEPELREITMRSLARPRNNRSKPERHSLGEDNIASFEAQFKPGGYFTLPAMSKLSNTPSFFGENPAKKDPQSKSSQQPKDLFELANRRRATRDGDLVSGSLSLAEGMDKFQQPKKVEKSLSLSVENEQRGLSKEISSVYSRYLVLYDYEPKNADELKLKEGEYVRVLEKCEDGWYVGFSEAKDEFGTFPGNYVQLVS